MKKPLKSLGLLIAIFGVLIICVGIAIQLIPYGKVHNNPAVSEEPPWDSPGTRQLAQRACFDCHSNETNWNWYSNIAPFSWLIYHDVQEGRSRLNFSEWNRPQKEELDEVGEVVIEGEMPPSQYLLIHPEARLSTAERELLAQGLQLSLGQ